jgi:hypothetical protein
VARGSRVLNARTRAGGGAAVAEAVVTGAGGALLGWVVGRPFGIGPVSAVLGGANGALSGARGVYDWRRVSGAGAFVVDSTWSLVNTAAALALHGASAARGNPEYVDELSRRHGRHVYARGFAFRRGFALSMGNVITGAGDVDPSTPRGVRRRALVDRHEQLHIGQARTLGPLFPLCYVAWMLGGVVYASALWLRHRDQGWTRLVESAAYYRNPFEVAAYKRDRNWPPRGLHPLLRPRA